MYRAPWWLRGAHLQTIWGRVFRTGRGLPLRELRWDTPDGDFLDVYRLDAGADRPRVIALHGLEGTHDSHYGRALVQEAAARNWGVDFMTFRSCGKQMNRTCRFYHSGETGDIDFVVRRVASEFPNAPLLLAGVSLGGNVLLKWLGESEGDVPGSVTAAAAISVPFDLAQSARAIHVGFSRVYEHVFLSTLLRKAAIIRRTYPDRNWTSDLTRIRSIEQFDDAVTAPLHGFRDAQDYYARSSAIRFLSGIRTPTLLLSARDDPFLPRHVLNDVERLAASNPNLLLEFSENGGHVGFVAGRNPFSPEYYAERRVFRFFDNMLDQEA